MAKWLDRLLDLLAHDEAAPRPVCPNCKRELDGSACHRCHYDGQPRPRPIDDSKPQVAGKLCAVCGQKIIFHGEGQICRVCEQPLHDDCAPHVHRAADEGGGPYR